MAYTLKEDRFGTVATNVALFHAADNQLFASRFKPGSSYTLTRVDLKMRKGGTPSGSFTLEIWTNDGNKPGRILTASRTSIARAAIAGSYTVYSFMGISLPVTSGTEYWFVLRSSGVGTYLDTESPSITDPDGYPGWSAMQYNSEDAPATLWANSGTDILQYQTFSGSGVLVGAVLSTTNPASWSVDIPPDCNLVYFLWSYWGSTVDCGLASATLAGVSGETLLEAFTTADATAVGGVEWKNPAVGTQTLAASFDSAAVEGPLSFLIAFKGADVTRERSADFARGIGDAALSFTLSTAANDLVAKFDQHYSASAPALTSGWTDGGTLSNVDEYGRVSYIEATGSTQSVTNENPSYSTLLAFAVKPMVPNPWMVSYATGTSNGTVSAASSLTGSVVQTGDLIVSFNKREDLSGEVVTSDDNEATGSNVYTRRAGSYSTTVATFLDVFTAIAKANVSGTLSVYSRFQTPYPNFSRNISLVFRAPSGYKFVFDNAAAAGAASSSTHATTGSFSISDHPHAAVFYAAEYSPGNWVTGLGWAAVGEVLEGGALCVGVRFPSGGSIEAYGDHTGDTEWSIAAVAMRMIPTSLPARRPSKTRNLLPQLGR